MSSREPARVCVVSASVPPAYGGAEIAAYRYAQRLKDEGSDVLLLAPAPPSLAERIDRPAHVRPIAVANDTHLMSIWSRLWPELWRLRNRFEIVHVFNSRSPFNLLAVPAARMLGKPVILEMSLMGTDDPESLRSRSSRSAGRRRRLSPPPARYALFRMGNAYVAKSHALCDAYRAAGLPESKLHRIPYAVDTELYSPAGGEERRSLRLRLGIPIDRTVVLFVGGMTRRKGVHWLLEAFRSLTDRIPESQLVIVGPTERYDSSYVESQHRLALEVGLDGHVSFVHGVIGNIHDYMRAADIFVLPSQREGLPISVLEAMACGLGLIASDIPEIARSQIRHGIGGLLFPVGDVRALRDAMGQLISDPGLRIDLGAEARRRALAEFSPAVVDPQYARLYAALTGGGGSLEGGVESDRRVD